MKDSDQERHGGFPGDSVVKNLPANAGDRGSIPDLARSHMLRTNEAHEPQLLSLCFSAGELQLLSPHAPTTEALAPYSPGSTAKKSPPREAHAPQQGACTPQLERSPCSLHPQKSPLRKEDPSQPKTNKIIFKKTKSWDWSYASGRLVLQQGEAWSKKKTFMRTFRPELQSWLQD